MCVACSEGKFSLAGSSSCSFCSPGYFAPSKGAAVCQGCPQGYFTSAPGSVSCKPCALGSYVNTTASTACNECYAGKFASQLASTSCSNCNIGSYSYVGNSTCLVCDAGYYAPSTTAVVGVDPCSGMYVMNIFTICLYMYVNLCVGLHNIQIAKREPTPRRAAPSASPVLSV